MEANPYAPPKAHVADIGPASTGGLWRRSVVLTVVFMIFSFGLYYPVWFFRRRAAFNRLNSPRKLQLWPLLYYCAVLVADLGVAIAAGDRPQQELIGDAGTLAIAAGYVSSGIVMLFQCFKVKNILEDHLTPDHDGSPSFFVQQVRLSGVLTFFLQVFYLQHIINRDIVGPAETRV